MSVELASKKTIIIVGAGISALAAANRLKNAGYTNVRIFEATNVIGGRISTKNFGNGWVEVGAQWIHGEKNNIAYDIAARNHLLCKHDLKELTTSSYNTEDGEEVDINLVHEVYTFLDDSLDSSVLENFNRTKVVNIEDYLNQKFEELMKKKSANLTDANRAIMRGILRWFKAFGCSIDACDSLSEISTASHLTYVKCDGNSLVNFENGYRTLVETMASDISPKSTIYLNKPVVQLDLQSVENGVRVVCADATEYHADHVIVTSSLGFLKQNASTMFHPALPPEKLQTIQKLGFGTVNKIFIEFERPFWPPGSGGYSLIWKRDFDDHPEHNWGQAIFGFYTVPFASNVLCGWLTGSSSRYMETLSDDQVVATCLYLLQRFTSVSKLPPVKSMIRSRWHENYFTRGSYTYFTNDQITNEELSKPLCKVIGNVKIPLVLFAGEATHPRFYSTVHGAIETGYREAERLIKHYLDERKVSRSNL